MSRFEDPKKKNFLAILLEIGQLSEYYDLSLSFDAGKISKSENQFDPEVLNIIFKTLDQFFLHVIHAQSEATDLTEMEFQTSIDQKEKENIKVISDAIKTYCNEEKSKSSEEIKQFLNLVFANIDYLSLIYIRINRNYLLIQKWCEAIAQVNVEDRVFLDHTETFHDIQDQGCDSCLATDDNFQNYKFDFTMNTVEIFSNFSLDSSLDKRIVNMKRDFLDHVSGDIFRMFRRATIDHVNLILFSPDVMQELGDLCVRRFDTHQKMSVAAKIEKSISLIKKYHDTPEAEDTIFRIFYNRMLKNSSPNLDYAFFLKIYAESKGDLVFCKTDVDACRLWVAKRNVLMHSRDNYKNNLDADFALLELKLIYAQIKYDIRQQYELGFTFGFSAKQKYIAVTEMLEGIKALRNADFNNSNWITNKAAKQENSQLKKLYDELIALRLRVQNSCFTEKVFRG